MRMRFGTFLIVLFSVNPAWAILDLFVKETIQVYGKPDNRSKSITVLEPGDRVVISPTQYGLYRKVLLRSSKVPVAAYIFADDIMKSEIRERSEFSADGIGPGYLNHFGMGVLSGFSYSMQSGRAIETTGGDSYQIESLTGSALYFGAYLDIPIRPNQFQVRAYFALRNLSAEGTAKPENGSGPNAQIKATQSFYSLGVVARFYGTGDNDLWYGGGIEFAQTSKANLSVKNVTAIELDPGGKPLYIIPFAALGYNFNVYEQYYLLPEMRLAGAINSTPKIYLLEVLLAGGVSF
jgi:hypothetical protein